MRADFVSDRMFHMRFYATLRMCGCVYTQVAHLFVSFRYTLLDMLLLLLR